MGAFHVVEFMLIHSSKDTTSVTATKMQDQIDKLNENLLGIAIPASFRSLSIARICSHSQDGVLFYFYFFAFYCFGGGTVSEDSTALLYCNEQFYVSIFFWATESPDSWSNITLSMSVRVFSFTGEHALGLIF